MPRIFAKLFIFLIFAAFLVPFYTHGGGPQQQPPKRDKQAVETTLDECIQLIKDGKPKEAIPRLERILSSIKTRTNLVICLDRLGLAYLQIATAVDPPDQEALKRGVYYYERNLGILFDMANEMDSDALRQNYIAQSLTLSNMFATMGNTQKATTWYKNSMKMRDRLKGSKEKDASYADSLRTIVLAASTHTMDRNYGKAYDKIREGLKLLGNKKCTMDEEIFLLLYTADFYLSLNSPKDAEPYLRRIRNEIKTVQSEWLHTLIAKAEGDLFALKKDTSGAFMAYRKALTLAGKNNDQAGILRIRSRIADLYYQTGSFETAVKTYESTGFVHADAIYLTRAYLKLGRTDDALQRVQIMLRLEAADMGDRLNLAHAYQGLAEVLESLQASGNPIHYTKDDRSPLGRKYLRSKYKNVGVPVTLGFLKFDIETCRRKARELINEIIAKIPTQKLKQSFLSSREDTRRNAK